MAKQSKLKQTDEPRRIGPKFARNVIPENFQIRRPTSPMADLLEEALRKNPEPEVRKGREASPPESAPVKTTPVETTLVKSGGVIHAADIRSLPTLDAFLDQILPRFPPPRQAILLRLYRWCEGTERMLIVSTPRLAAKTNMDEKVCRNHLHALIAEGFLTRSSDGEQIAKFGGSDRNARGLLLKLSSQSLFDLIH